MEVLAKRMQDTQEKHRVRDAALAEKFYYI